MKILIIGAGMYVTGRNQTGTGTILSSIAQFSKTNPIEKIVIAAKSKSNNDIVKQETRRINQTINSSIETSYVEIQVNTKKFVEDLCNKNDFDCAIISIPDHLHFDFTYELMKNGIHCLVVKPLVGTVRENIQLIDIQKETKTYGAVEFHKRFDETNLFIKKALNDKNIGKLLYFTVDYSQKIDIPLNVFKSWAAQTNIFQYLGVHYVDMIFFLTGFLPFKVMSYGTRGVLVEKGINTYDSVHASIVWRSPNNKKETFISQFNTNWIDPNCTSAMSDQKYKIIGTNGRIECDQKNRGLEVVCANHGIRQINPYFSDYLPGIEGTLEFSGYGYKSISQFFIDVMVLKENDSLLSSFEKTRPTFSQALVSTTVIEAVNNSLTDNNWREIQHETF